MRKFLLIVALALTLALFVRVAEATQQCYFPTFTFSRACFVNAVLTGEDVAL